MLLVFLLAKFLVVVSRDLNWSVPMFLALLWQDLAITVVVGALFWLVRYPSLQIAIYGIASLLTAISVVLYREFSTPLTRRMLAAAGTTLGDSIAVYFTATNVALLLGCLASSILAPVILRNFRPKPRVLLPGLLLALAGVGAGWYLTPGVEMAGIHRNAIWALTRSFFPTVAVHEHARNWRQSPFHFRQSQSLDRFQGKAQGRNVIVVVLESTGASYLKPYGAPSDPMPCLTRLAEKAVVFENAYCVYPESIKGLLSVLCSRYPAIDVAAESAARITTPALPSVLARHGYDTGLFHSGRFMYLGMDAVVEDRGFQTLEDAGAIGGQMESSFGVDEFSTVDKMLRWVDGRKRPFFLMYLPIAGHHPYQSPFQGPFSEKSEKGRYLNALSYADKALERLVEGLKTRGLLEESLLVIFGDHGEAFGQHEGNYAHTLFIYEENIRVPFLICLPGMIAERVPVSRPASLIDTAPTILDLLGISGPEDYQGVSLLDPRERMALFFTDYSLPLLGMRDGDDKMIFDLESRNSYRFDLREDPLERRNLRDRNTSLMKRYQKHLVEWRASQKALFR